MHRALRIIYSAVYLTALLFMLPYELMRRSSEVRLRWMRERAGGGSPLTGDAPTLWVHAVSVGETIAASTFIREFLKRHTGARVMLTTVTDTGQRVAAERLGSLCDIRYVPFDLSFCVRRFIALSRPAALVIMETELWPNMIAVAHDAGVPIAMMNGRISERSFGRYMKFQWAIAGVMRDIDLLCMQDNLYAERAMALGAAHRRVQGVGNFKFDISLAEKAAPQWIKALKSPVVIAGSTHRGEEALLAGCFKRLHEQYPALTMVIVPRHPERFDEVEGVVRASGARYFRRTALGGAEDLTGAIVILDTVGELSSAYSACDVAVVGGSFIPHGGQNPLEPAYFAKPVITGPHMFNFPFVRDFYDAGAALEVRDASGLYDALRSLLSDPLGARERGQKGLAILEANRGAVGRALDLFDQIWRAHGAS